MTVTAIDFEHASPYMTRGTLAASMGVNPQTVDNRVREIKEEIKKGRYNEMAIIKDGGVVLINYLVMMDYMFYRSRLKEKNLRKNVPRYNPRVIAEQIGWWQ